MSDKTTKPAAPDVAQECLPVNPPIYPEAPPTPAAPPPLTEFSAAWWDINIQAQQSLVAQLEGAVAAQPLYQQLVEARGELKQMEHCRELALKLAGSAG